MTLNLSGILPLSILRSPVTGCVETADIFLKLHAAECGARKPPRSPSPTPPTPTPSSLQVTLARPSAPKLPGSGEMSESGAAPCPQVFVVDSRASCVSAHTGTKARWSAVGQKPLLLLLGLAMLGLVVEASLIYNLYRKMEVR